MRQQTSKPFARQNKNKQNGFGICYHFAIKQEMRFSKSECFQGFSAHHIHFFLIPTRCRDSHLKQFCLEDIVPAILIILITHIIVAIRWMLIKILSAVIKHRGEYTVIVVDWFRCIIA